MSAENRPLKAGDAENLDAELERLAKQPRRPPIRKTKIRKRERNRAM